MPAKKLMAVVIAVAVAIAIAIPLLKAGTRTVVALGESDLKEAIVTECTYSNFRTRTRNVNTGYRSYYTPIALTRDGDRAVGTAYLPRRALCERMIGTSVPMFVHSDDAKKNRIGSFVQLWVLPFFGLSIGILMLLRNAGRVQHATAASLAMVAAVAVSYEYGYFGLNRPETNLTSVSGRFDACVNKAMSDQGTRTRADLKKLACNPLPDIETLQEFASVEDIQIINSAFESLRELPNFPKLKKLSIRNSALRSLDGLDRFSQLTHLRLTEVTFSSISDIPNSGTMRHLRISSNPSLHDLAGIERFTALEHLEIERNQVSDISALSALADLKGVQIFYEPVTDLTPLAELDALEVARFRSLDTHDFSPLYNKPKMRHSGATGATIPCEEMQQWMLTLEPLRRKFMWLPKQCKFLKAELALADE